MNETPEFKDALGLSTLIVWIVCYVVAVLVALMGATLKIRTLLVLRRRRREEFSFANVVQHDAYTTKHATRRGDTKVEIKLGYADLSSGLLEDLPFGFLGLRYILKKAEHHNDHQISYMLMLSVASSFLMLGIKLSQLALLATWWKYESKQRKKMGRMALGSTTQDFIEWLKSIAELKACVGILEQKGATGAQMCLIESDGPLIDLGMDSEVERKCLLLQLARVRKARQLAALTKAGKRSKLGLLIEDEPEPAASVPLDSSAQCVASQNRDVRSGSIELQPLNR